MVRANVKIYVEGGGDSNALRTECRRGFQLFLQKADLCGRMPKIVACGSRTAAFHDFQIALKTMGRTGELPVLLVDSEDFVKGKTTWDHVFQREGDRWRRPEGATDSQLHLMVQCMESWFLADPDALAKYYKKDFDSNGLAAPDVETIEKSEVFRRLNRATRNTTKGAYDKGGHSFAILAMISPDRVSGASAYAKRFIDFLKQMLR